jgi:[FeFe] hydrogenase H-cluster maturation GTPase HydF
MSMNSTPRGERAHIAIFGRRNAGKSSVINALTNQEISIVSHIKGTTTDPVYKAMELLPIGPVVFIDTAGLDDTGILGELRIEKTYNILNKTDLALLVIDATVGLNEFEEKILKTINEKKVSVVGAVNKIDEADNVDALLKTLKSQTQIPLVPVSATQKIGIDELKTCISDNMPKKQEKFQIVGDLLNPGDFVVLVTPIGDNRFTGICQSVCRYSQRHSAYIFFNSFCTVQRRSA